MKIYIDIKDDFRCHASDATGQLLPYETEFFDGMCDEFIEGYQCVPTGYTWTRSDGEVFSGEMIAPMTDYNELHIAQLEYELADADEALREVGAI